MRSRFESAGSGSSALGQGTLSSLSSPSEGLKAVGPLVACLYVSSLLSYRPGKINPTLLSKIWIHRTVQPSEPFPRARPEPVVQWRLPPADQYPAGGGAQADWAGAGRVARQPGASHQAAGRGEVQELWAQTAGDARLKGPENRPEQITGTHQYVHSSPFLFHRDFIKRSSTEILMLNTEAFKAFPLSVFLQ